MIVRRSTLRSFIIALAFLALAGSFTLKQEDSFSDSIKRGEALYKNHCIACHMQDGKGIQGVFPPLAGADYLLENPDNSIKAILNGLTGEITVNGVVYFGEMLPIKLSDEEVADVMNFISNSWGNKSKEITPEKVAVLRKD